MLYGVVLIILQVSDHGGRRHKQIIAAVGGKEYIYVSYTDSNARLEGFCVTTFTKCLNPPLIHACKHTHLHSHTQYQQTRYKYV